MLYRPYSLYYFILVLWFICSSVHATVFGVMPVQLFLSSKQPIGIVKVTNNSKTDSLVQLSIVSWQQKGGKDIYCPSNDILMTPPLFKLPAHKTQVIRFVLRYPKFNFQQQTYRMHIREVGLGKHVNSDHELYFLMDFSLPLFIQPQRSIEQFVWSTRYLDSQHIDLRLYNDGNVTLLVSYWQLLDKNQDLFAKQATFTYLLPGHSHHWVIIRNANADPTTIKATINGQTKKSTLHRF
jgi:fimbrial chaperone protein